MIAHLNGWSRGLYKIHLWRRITNPKAISCIQFLIWQEHVDFSIIIMNCVKLLSITLQKIPKVYNVCFVFYIFPYDQNCYWYGKWFIMCFSWIYERDVDRCLVHVSSLKWQTSTGNVRRLLQNLSFFFRT